MTPFTTTYNNKILSIMEANTISQISCVSLGMLIMDEIRMPNKSPLLNVIGGSSTFVTLGLRLFAGCPSSVGCLILAGSDLPPEVENEVRSWGTTLVLKKDATKPSSRGLLVYEDDTFGPKTFEYVTPPIRASPKGLEGTPLLNATAFHFFGRPEEIIEQVPQLLYLREEQSPELPRPFIVWEPLPSSCTPTAIPDFHAACKLVDVISPNHLEFAALFFWDRGHQSDGAGTLERLKNLGKVFVDSGIGPDGTGTMVIRAGADGALALRRNEPAVHVPAYYEHGDEKVVDPTGAGNAFLGGYIAGWLREGDVREALCYGAVAASLALEQIGLPRRGDVNAGLGEERLEEFRARMENAEWTDDA